MAKLKEFIFNPETGSVTMEFDIQQEDLERPVHDKSNRFNVTVETPVQEWVEALSLVNPQIGEMADLAILFRGISADFQTELLQQDQTTLEFDQNVHKTRQGYVVSLDKVQVSHHYMIGTQVEEHSNAEPEPTPRNVKGAAIQVPVGMQKRGKA